LTINVSTSFLHWFLEHVTSIIRVSLLRPINTDTPSGKGIGSCVLFGQIKAQDMNIFRYCVNNVWGVLLNFLFLHICRNICAISICLQHVSHLHSWEIWRHIYWIQFTSFYARELHTVINEIWSGVVNFLATHEN
jgi:hypothetical protein